MSPRVLNSKDSFSKDFKKEQELKKLKGDLKKLKKFVENNFEFVGDKFAQRVREVYYDKNGKKNIYGTTTNKERNELLEEGIELVSLPWVEEEN